MNYGGSYYSYAYAMCLASSVWEKLFQDDPLSRHAGTNHLCDQQSLLLRLNCHAHCNSPSQQRGLSESTCAKVQGMSSVSSSLQRF